MSTLAPEARNLLRSVLINAGVAGVRQSHLTLALRNHARKYEFLPVLEYWKSLGAVQKFRDESQEGRPKTIWRATDKLLEIT